MSIVIIWMFGATAAVFLIILLVLQSREKALADRRLAESEKKFRLFLENSKIERKKMEQEMADLKASFEQHVQERTTELEYVNKELEAFTFSVSHDLRAPLRAIDGFSKFLQEDYGNKMDTEAMRLIHVIRSNTKRMDQLITDLLTLSRVNKSRVNYCQIDMNALVASILQETLTEEIRSSFKITVDTLSTAWGDVSLIRQVWFNLISNAVKYTMKSLVKEIAIGNSIENGQTVFYVKDSGIGFDTEYINKLFCVFQRLHNAEDFEGNGVGLAIVQRIIIRHKGRVWAEGKKNSGAVFYFSMPWGKNNS